MRIGEERRTIYIEPIEEPAEPDRSPKPAQVPEPALPEQEPLPSP